MGLTETLMLPLPALKGGSSPLPRSTDRCRHRATRTALPMTVSSRNESRVACCTGHRDNTSAAVVPGSRRPNVTDPPTVLVWVPLFRGAHTSSTGRVRHRLSRRGHSPHRPRRLQRRIQREPFPYTRRRLGPAPHRGQHPLLPIFEAGRGHATAPPARPG